MSINGSGQGYGNNQDAQGGAKKAGPEGTVPGTKDGVGMGAGKEPNTFEPEEDPAATAESTEKVEGTPVDTSEPS